MKLSVKRFKARRIRPLEVFPTKGPQSSVQGLLVEGDRGLFLAEVGLGTLDYIAPLHRLRRPIPQPYQHSPLGPARLQLVAAGYRPEDVSDIFVSHLDPLHCGGIDDFPHARVHILPGTTHSDSRFRPRGGSSTQKFVENRAAQNRVFGFQTYSIEFEGVEFSLVELKGPFRHHAGLVIPYNDGHVFHVGFAVQCLTELKEPLSKLRNLPSILTSPLPFSQMETLSQLRRLYQHSNSRIIFVSNNGHLRELNRFNDNVPGLQPLNAEADG